MNSITVLTITAAIAASVWAIYGLRSLLEAARRNKETRAIEEKMERERHQRVMALLRESRECQENLKRLLQQSEPMKAKLQEFVDKFKQAQA